MKAVLDVMFWMLAALFLLAPYVLILVAAVMFFAGGPAWATLAVGVCWLVANKLAFVPLK